MVSGGITDKHFDRMVECVEFSFTQDRPSRELHRTINEHMMGDYYPRRDRISGCPSTPINLLSLAKRAMSRSLISKSPRVLANTDNPQFKSWSEDAQIACNNRIVKSNLNRVLRDVADQSMVSMGIMFFGADYVGDGSGMKLSLVTTAVDRLDFVYDVNAATVEEADFQGHKFRMVLPDVQEHPWFDEAARKDVQPNPSNSWSDSDETKRTSGTFGGATELYDYVDIWMVYERRRNKVFYYPCHQKELKLLEMDWHGPDHGPYRYLYYEKPAGHALPIAPMQHLLIKHKAFNFLDAKTINQQQTAKGVLTYNSASKDDAERLAKSTDNESVLRENGGVAWAHVGGADPATVAMAANQKKDFSYATSGIVEQFMQQGDTLGQERLLKGASNEMLADMEGHANLFITGVCEDVFFYDLRDPDPNYNSVERKIEGTDITYQSDWSAMKRRMVQDMRFNITVEAYSYRERSPDARLADVMGGLQFYMQFAEQAMAQGVMVDVDGLMKLIASYRNLPELNDILIRNQDPAELAQFMGGGSGGQNKNQSSGPRRYIRESKSDGAGEDIEMLRNMGRGQQNQQQMVGAA